MAVLKEVELTKKAYEHFRRVYPTAELCVSVNNDVATHNWAKNIAKKDPNFKFVWTEGLITFSENYNKAVSLATKDKIVLYHNDMVPAPGFLERLDENLDPMFVLGYTTIEPPVFKDHVRPGKIVQDFGSDFSNFKVNEFEEYTSTITEELSDGAFFFLSCFKQTFDLIGGFDERTFIPVFCEDDDFILRLIHAGCIIKTTSKAVVYHFVSRTIRFSNVPMSTWNQSSDSVEANAQRNFLRKWGGRYYGYLNKRVGVFDIGYNVKRATTDILRALEPLAKNLQVDCSPNDYVMHEQSKTRFNLGRKFVEKVSNQIIVDIDCNKLNQTTYNHLAQLPVLLSTLKDVGDFKYSEFTVHVKTIPENLVDTLIKIERVR
jgi:GT2 family glycosyltransferase